MPKPCFGTIARNSDRMKESRAFCEGIQYRAGDTGALRPISGNPHALGSDASTAWRNGWLLADGSSGSTVAPTSAPCCAVPQAIIPV